ncbi:MAG: zinc ABC transporter substrate-binding protein [Actinomycetia bacterium]|nr:zinc ABC transporter substrate-binding protein [Actinomycetes bacterium]
MLRFSATLVTAGMLCAAVGCGSDSEEPQAIQPAQKKPLIVTAFYPVQWLADELVGDQAEVVSLTPPGTEPHDLSLTADDLKAMRRADVVLYLGDDFQPNVQRVVDDLDGSTETLDLLTVPGIDLIDAGEHDHSHDHSHGDNHGNDHGNDHAHGENDPHIWLSPVDMEAAADAAASAITTAIPDLSGQVDQALPTLQRSLRDLDAEYRRGLADCASRVLVTSHAAFGYLADEYNLEQVPIAGLSPEEEPDPQTLQSIVEVVNQRDVGTVFFEDALPDDLARTVADETGAELSMLSALEFDPRGSIGPNENYITVMKGNLDRIEKGLGCTAS